MILQKEEPFFSCGYAVFLLKTNEPATPQQYTEKMHKETGRRRARPLIGCRFSAIFKRDGRKERR
jgi:hypothetical protein